MGTSLFDELEYLFGNSSGSCNESSGDSSISSDGSLDDDLVIMAVGLSMGSGSFVGISGGSTSTSEGPDAFVDTVSSFTDTYGGGIDGSTQGCLMAGVASTVIGTGYSTSEGEPDAVIEVFFRNETPYARTELRATNVYAVIHGDKPHPPKFPVVMARCPEHWDSTALLFNAQSVDLVNEKLTVLENLLKSCLS